MTCRAPLLFVLLSLVPFGTQASEFEPIAIPKRLLVLAPHPDDAMLAAGLITRTLAQGGAAQVIDLTCGDGNSPLAVAYVKRKGFRPTEVDGVNYGYWRQREDQAAVAELGLGSEQLVFLGYPDSGLWKILHPKPEATPSPYRSRNTHASEVPYLNAATPGAPYLKASVLSDLRRLIQAFAPDLLVLPHPNDHHPDHAATWYFGNEALAASGLDLAGVRILAPFDFYAGDLPHSLKRDFRMRPTRQPPSPTEWQELELTDAEFEAKVRMTDHYRSQMAWEHPLEKEYRGKISYMYGYVARNELYGRVLETREDPGYSRRVEQKALPSRVTAIIGNLFTDLGRRLFGH